MSPLDRPVPKKVVERVEQILATRTMPDWGLLALLRDMAFYAGARGRYCEWCSAHFEAVLSTQTCCSKACSKSHGQQANREHRAEIEHRPYNPHFRKRRNA